MSTALAEAFVRFRADASQIKPDVDKAVDSVDAEGSGTKTGKKFGGGLTGGLKSTIGGFAGVLAGAGIVKFGKDSVAAYSDAQESQKRLADAFDRFPKLADTNQGALQKLNSQLQLKTKYDDDNIASGQAVLAQFGVTGSQLKATTPLLLDYASKTGKDIPAAAQDVGKALLGNAKALKNIGIKYTATGDTQKDFTNITALMRAQVGGFAQKEGATAAGQTAILKNQFGELEEGVGSKLVPTLSALITRLTGVVVFVGQNLNVIGPLVGVIGALGIAVWAVNAAAKAYAATQAAVNLVTGSWIGALGRAIAAGAVYAAQVTLMLARAGAYLVVQGASAVATSAWTAAQWLLNAALTANPIGLIIAGIALLIGIIILSYKHSATFRAIVTGAFHAVLAAGQAVWGWISSNFPKLLNILKAPFTGAVGGIKTAWGGITTFFSGLPKKLVGALATVGSALTSPFRTAFNYIADAWNNTAGRLSFSIPSWVPKIGGKGFSMPKLPHFANGINDFAGGFAVVGERGRETVWLPPGSSVTPNGRTPANAPRAPQMVTVQLVADGRMLAETVVGPLGDLMSNRPI